MKTKKELENMTKEKLIVYADKYCDGMELKDESLKADMIKDILDWEPEVKPVEKIIAKPKPVDDFESWFLNWLQTVDVLIPHSPEAHGCLGGVPVCGLCDHKMPTAKQIYDGQR